jgi:hypothetical protein
MTQTSVSASGAFSSEAAVTVTAGVAVLDLTTLAYIGSFANVSSDGNVLVKMTPPKIRSPATWPAPGPAPSVLPPASAC